jgi:hypothetical protein
LEEGAAPKNARKPGETRQTQSSSTIHSAAGESSSLPDTKLNALVNEVNEGRQRSPELSMQNLKVFFKKKISANKIHVFANNVISQNMANNVISQLSSPLSPVITKIYQHEMNAPYRIVHVYKIRITF